LAFGEDQELFALKNLGLEGHPYGDRAALGIGSLVIKASTLICSRFEGRNWRHHQHGGRLEAFWLPLHLLSSKHWQALVLPHHLQSYSNHREHSGIRSYSTAAAIEKHTILDLPRFGHHYCNAVNLFADVWAQLWISIGLLVCCHSCEIHFGTPFLLGWWRQLGLLRQL
jgi:hypothetical protein